jgi:hypothetical protein
MALICIVAMTTRFLVELAIDASNARIQWTDAEVPMCVEVHNDSEARFHYLGYEVCEGLGLGLGGGMGSGRSRACMQRILPAWCA